MDGGRTESLHVFSRNNVLYRAIPTYGSSRLFVSVTLRVQPSPIHTLKHVVTNKDWNFNASKNGKFQNNRCSAPTLYAHACKLTSGRGVISIINDSV
jgi:hypothetical protein